MRYQRVRNGNDVVSEQITGAGTLIADFTYSPSGASGRQDFDGDGFFEWRGTLTRGSNPDLSVEILEYDQYTQQLFRRRTRAQQGTTVHHVWQLDQGGGLETIREFDASPNQASDGSPGATGHVTAAQAGTHAEFGWFDCGSDVRKQLTDGLEQCMKKVMPCLDKHKDSALKTEMTKLLAGKVTFTCTTGGPIGENRGTTQTPMGSETTIRINTDRLSEVSTESLICHELMHSTSLGEHDTDLTENPQEFDDSELDRVKSCTALCFGGSLITNQCHCATCLDTTVCDERCKPYKPCQNCEKGVCPCESGKRYYASLSNCKAKCPTSSQTGNGLKCFAQQCKGLSVCCKKK